MGHVGEKFALCRVCLPHPLQKLHDGLLLLLSRHHGLCDVLMVSVQAGAGFLESFVRYAAAANVNSPQLWMIPGVDHLRAAVLQYFPNRLLHHHHIVRRNALKPVPIARLRPDPVRYAQQDPHGPVGIHPRRAALLQLDRPDSGPGSLQNVFQTPPCLQLVLLLLFHHGVDVPLGKNRAVPRLRSLGSGKVDLQVL